MSADQQKQVFHESDSCRAPRSARAYVIRFLVLSGILAALLALDHARQSGTTPSDGGMTARAATSSTTGGQRGNPAHGKQNNNEKTGHEVRGTSSLTGANTAVTGEGHDHTVTPLPATGNPVGTGTQTRYGSLDWPDDPTSGQRSIAGRVLDNTGRTLFNIPLSARWIRALDSNDPPVGDVPEQSTRTDGAGNYAFHGLPAGEYVIRAAGELAGGTERFAPATTFARGGARSVDLVLNRLREIWVFGTVMDTRDKPLADVHVALSDDPSQNIVTDQSGGFSLKVALAEGRNTASLGFYRKDYRYQKLLLERAAWQDEKTVRLDAQLTPLGEPGAVTGTIMDKSGKPVPGQIVQLYSNASDRRYYASSNARGEFRVPDVEPAAGYRILVQPPSAYKDYNQGNLQIAAGQELSVSVTLEPLGNARLAGLMVDPSGKPIPGFPLTVRSAHAYDQLVPVVGDGQGVFVAENIPEGPLVLATTHAPSMTINGLQGGQSEGEPVPLVLDLGEHEVRGRVLDAAGKPVPMAEVNLSWSQSRGRLQSTSRRQTVSDSQGFFFFTQLGAGEHRIVARLPGQAPVERSYQVGQQSGMATLQLGPNAQAANGNAVTNPFDERI